MIKLGQQVQDQVSGFEGTATARCEYLNGCVRFCIEGEADKKGEIQEYWIDQGRLIVVNEKHLSHIAFDPKNYVDVSGPGGPARSTPPSRKGPSGR